MPNQPPFAPSAPSEAAPAPGAVCWISDTGTTAPRDFVTRSSLEVLQHPREEAPERTGCCQIVKQAYRKAPDRGCRQAFRWLNRIMLPDGSENAQSLTPYA